MKIRSLALAGLFVLSLVSARAQFASAVVDYTPGTGAANGFTNTGAALGAPASGASITPFSPPFSKSQIISVGTNGSLTLRFDQPIINDPSNPFGLDFLVFGNTFFSITNHNFSGGGITSGAIGGNNTGATSVEVSADGVNWYTLNPALAPTADNIYPTDGLGDPRLPVDPALTTNDFGGLGLAGIHALYHGSAGGTGYDLSWAQDTNGNFVNIPIVRYVRINVLANKSEIDAVSSVAGTLPVFADDFYNDPLQHGWQVFGDTNLFHWNPTNQNVEVTWDSTNVNSYLYHPLGTVLTSDDAFSVSFDFQLNDLTTFGGANEITVGLFNLADATNADFSRAGGNSPNLFEFDYFPANAYYDLNSIDASLKDNQPGYAGLAFAYDNLPLNPGVTYQIILSHAAGSTNITGRVLTNGVLYTSLPLYYPASINYFRLDTLSISSYTGDGFGDDILAHGVVDNFVVSLPPPAVQNLGGSIQGGQWQAQFLSRTNWTYTLERTADLQNWSAAASVAGNGTNTVIADPATPPDKAFYRIRADRP
jgi:hypothetical protein